jgi:hypothetical protein
MTVKAVEMRIVGQECVELYPEWPSRTGAKHKWTLLQVAKLTYQGTNQRYQNRQDSCCNSPLTSSSGSLFIMG